MKVSTISTTWILIIAIGAAFFLLLFSYNNFRSVFQKSATKAIIIPKNTFKSAYTKSKRSKREYAVKIDYEQDSDMPQKIKFKQGKNGSVNPGLFNSEEIIAHSHPSSDSRDLLSRIYETELRERPSTADLMFSKLNKSKEFLITPSDRIIEYDAEQADFGKLHNIESKVQRQASSIIPVSDLNSAKQSASLANKLFIRETEQAGVRYTEFSNSKDIKLQTKVK